MKITLSKLVSRKTVALGVVLFSCTATGLITLNAQDEKKSTPAPADIAKAMELMAPGAAHKALEAYVGEWTLHTKVWMQPGAPPMESDGTASTKWILGKRFVESNVSTTMMGQPFEGRSISGYDNMKKIYTSFWIDNMGTAMTTITGSASADGKTFTYKGKMDDAFTGKMNQDYKFVDTFVSKDEIKAEIFTLADGKETKMMEMAYKRKK